MTTREQWLAERRRGYGATDVPAILGLHPYREPSDVWANKVLGVETPENQAMRLGRLLEDDVAALYAEEHPGALVVAWPKFELARHLEHPLCAATPDFERVADELRPGLLECKTSWYGTGWEDGPPTYVEAQLQVQLGCTGRDQGAIAVLVGGREFLSWERDRNDRFLAAALPACDRWWAAHVDAGEPPPPASPEAARRLLELLHPGRAEPRAVSLEGLEEEVGLLDFLAGERAGLRHALDALDERVEELRNVIRERLGDAHYGATPDGRLVSWKLQRRRGYTVEPSEGRVFRLLKKPPKNVPGPFDGAWEKGDA